MTSADAGEPARAASDAAQATTGLAPAMTEGMAVTASAQAREPDTSQVMPAALAQGSSVGVTDTLADDPVFDQVRNAVAELGRADDNARLDRMLEALERPIVFVDLETTGGNAATDRITEIGIVEVSRYGVDTWSSLVDPGCEIPAFIQSLTGISNEMVRGQPMFASLAPALAARLKGRLFIAHNARFDYGFLQRSFERAEIAFESDMLCTVQLSRKLFPDAGRHGLSAIVERYALKPLGRHRALADADLVWQFWQVIHAQHSADAIRGAVDALTRRPSDPVPAPRRTRASAKASTGTP